MDWWHVAVEMTTAMAMIMMAMAMAMAPMLVALMADTTVAASAPVDGAPDGVVGDAAACSSRATGSRQCGPSSTRPRSEPAAGNVVHTAPCSRFAEQLAQRGALRRSDDQMVTWSALCRSCCSRLHTGAGRIDSQAFGFQCSAVSGSVTGANGQTQPLCTQRASRQRASVDDDGAVHSAGEPLAGLSG